MSAERLAPSPELSAEQADAERSLLTNPDPGPDAEQEPTDL